MTLPTREPVFNSGQLTRSQCSIALLSLSAY
jgi:hypothetical protein